MIYMKKKIKLIILAIIVLINLFACNIINTNDNFAYEVALDNYFNGEEVWILQNQTIAQSLNAIIKTNNNDLIIFDGGRKGDAEFLYKFIKRNGGKVSAWFLSHIHDDHVGAIYEIIENHKDIKIENLYYNFADFDYYYKFEGVDAGIVDILLAAFGEAKNRGTIIHDDIKMKDMIEVDGVKVEVMNDLYLLDEDGPNNSSMVYKAYIGDKTMIVFGDLAYAGGEKILADRGVSLKSDIVVMAHHGRGGVGEEVYKAVAPEIVIWPTTEKIYNSDGGKVTREWIEALNVKKEVLSYENTYVIK